MLAGQRYDCGDEELLTQWHRAKDLIRDYNRIDSANAQEKERILGELLGGKGENLWITAPFFVDYGNNIYFGDDCEVNMNCTFLDDNVIRIGNHALIAPNVQIYTAFHPTNAADRFGAPGRRSNGARALDNGSRCVIRFSPDSDEKGGGKQMLQQAIAAYYDFWYGLNHVYAVWARQHEISVHALFVLDVLRDQGDACTLRRLQDRLELPKQTIHTILDGLVRAGYLERRPAKGDRRTRQLCLTEAGRAYADSKLAPLYAWEKAAMGRLTAAERTAMCQCNRKFMQALREGLEEEP